MRLDKYISKSLNITRSESHKLIKDKNVSVNGIIVSDPSSKIDENCDEINVHGKNTSYAEFEYYMMNKPAGVITSTDDKKDKTVMDLFPKDHRKNLSPVGRLDKDTEGLILVTDNGELNHALLAPGRHVSKKYFVRFNGELKDEDIDLLETGVDIGEKKNTLPAIIDKLSRYECYITISEGKFHQIKRMFEAVGCKVEYLKRISMGELTLDENLAPGEIRKLTDEEVMSLLSHLK